ncbi:MAG TPA: hypothetical protein VKT28_05020 [Puia sp.]|nr:hypothetical protein [Puia sp.]
METNFYKITVYYRDSKPPKQGLRRLSGTKQKVTGYVMEEAYKAFGKENILKVDIWWLPETDKEVIEYKKKWL